MRHLMIVLIMNITWFVHIQQGRPKSQPYDMAACHTYSSNIIAGFMSYFLYVLSNLTVSLHVYDQ